MAVFAVIFSFMFFRNTLARQSCKHHLSEHGFALVDHVYKLYTADRLVTCYRACNTQPSCQSLNYNLFDNMHMCQFNNNTKYFRRKNFVKKANWAYANNPASGKTFHQKNLHDLFNLSHCFQVFFFIVHSMSRKKKINNATLFCSSLQLEPNWINCDCYLRRRKNTKCIFKNYSASFEGKFNYPVAR